MLSEDKIYFTSDLHFDDNWILNCDRPQFKTIEEMNELIIKNWNKYVPTDAQVYVLGDIGFTEGATLERIKSIITKLNGTKFLIIGNHDEHRTDKFYMDAGFEMVYRHPIILDNWYVLTHKPPEYMIDKVPWCWFYGHVHDTDMYTTFTKNTACVCCSRHNWAPVSFHKLKTVMRLSK